MIVKDQYSKGSTITCSIFPFISLPNSTRYADLDSALQSARIVLIDSEFSAQWTISLKEGAISLWNLYHDPLQL